MGTEKVDGGYENVGDNPPKHPHKFRSKKKADAQRKAMFVHGFKAHEALNTLDSLLSNLLSESLGSDSMVNLMQARGGMQPNLDKIAIESLKDDLEAFKSHERKIENMDFEQDEDDVNEWNDEWNNYMADIIRNVKKVFKMIIKNKTKVKNSKSLDRFVKSYVERITNMSDADELSEVVLEVLNDPKDMIEDFEHETRFEESSFRHEHDEIVDEVIDDAVELLSEDDYNQDKTRNWINNMVSLETIVSFIEDAKRWHLAKDHASIVHSAATLLAQDFLNAVNPNEFLNEDFEESTKGTNMNDKRLQEKITQNLVSKLKATPKSGEEHGFLQTIMDICYEDWQDNGPAKDKSWGEFIEYILHTYGDEAAIVVFFGAANYQIGNGGIMQYLDNGYASEKRGYFSNNSYDTDLQDQMLELASREGIFKTDTGVKVFTIFESIADVVQGVHEECYSCHNKRYVKCPECDGEGTVEDEDEDGNIDQVDCEECHGEGTAPCYDCNEEGQLEEDAKEGELDHKWLDRLDNMYYEIDDAWLKELDQYAFKAYKDEFEGQGLLGKAGAYK